jgi:hypothetical protein
VQTRLVLGLVIALVLSAPARAVPVTYTSSAAFFAALPGPPVTADFDGLSSGQVIASGASADGITFTYDFGGVDLIVTDGSAAGGGGPFDTTSPPHFLGTSDFDVLLDGDDLGLGFASARAIGLFIITAETPGLSLFDGDIGLSAAGAQALLDVDDVEDTLGDGSLVFFLGVIDSGVSFASASLDTFGGGGAFAFNVDDVVTAVPEPGVAALLGSGLLALAAWRRSPRADGGGRRLSAARASRPRHELAPALRGQLVSRSSAIAPKICSAVARSA